MCGLKAVRKLAAKYGAIVCDDKSGMTHECTVEAPKGYRWGKELHMFVDCANRPWEPDYADLLARMANGPELCDDAECEWCNEE